MEYRQILYIESKLKCIPFLEVSKLHVIQCASFVAGSHVCYSTLKPDGIYLFTCLSPQLDFQPLQGRHTLFIFI